MAEYQIIIADENGTPIGELESHGGLQCNTVLNGYGQCTFAIPATDTKLAYLTALRRYQTQVWRDGKLIWAGEQALRRGGVVKNSSNMVQITSFDWLEQLGARYTDAVRTFADTDAGEIAEALINESQALTNGDFGITIGTIVASKDRDRIYKNQNIMEAIVQLSKCQNGFDFEITPDKVFNVYYPRGRDKSLTDGIFELGVNIAEVSNIVEDFGQPCNEALVLSTGYGAGDSRRAVPDTSSQDVIRLRQQPIALQDVVQADTMDDYGLDLVRRQKQPLFAIEFSQTPDTEPTFGSIDLGDTVKIRVKYGIYDISNAFRVYGWNITLDRQNRETIKYIVGLQ
jgi:hypothetical protein